MWVSYFLTNISSPGPEMGVLPQVSYLGGMEERGERERMVNGQPDWNLMAMAYSLERCAPKSQKTQLCLPALCHDPAPMVSSTPHTQDASTTASAFPLIKAGHRLSLAFRIQLSLESRPRPWWQLFGPQTLPTCFPPPPLQILFRDQMSLSSRKPCGHRFLHQVPASEFSVKP